MVAANGHRLYCYIRLEQFIIHETIPLAVGDDDNIGKETAYRNTRLTGVTQGLEGPGADPAAGAPPIETVQPVAPAAFGYDDGSLKEQITKIEEKMGMFSLCRRDYTVDVRIFLGKITTTVYSTFVLRLSIIHRHLC